MLPHDTPRHLQALESRKQSALEAQHDAARMQRADAHHWVRQVSCANAHLTLTLALTLAQAQALAPTLALALTLAPAPAPTLTRRASPSTPASSHRRAEGSLTCRCANLARRAGRGRLGSLLQLCGYTVHLPWLSLPWLYYTHCGMLITAALTMDGLPVAVITGASAPWPPAAAGVVDQRPAHSAGAESGTTLATQPG